MPVRKHQKKDIASGCFASPSAESNATRVVKKRNADAVAEVSGADTSNAVPSIKFKEFSKARAAIERDSVEINRTVESSIITYGTVSITATKPDSETIRRNIKAGQEALKRAAKSLLKPGVKLNVKPNVPLYRADPDDPKLIIRLLNGREEKVKVVGGKFRVVK